MKNFDSYIDPHKVFPQGKITVAEYPPVRNGVEVEYVAVRWLKRDCLVCKHFTAARDLRKDKRYVVCLDKGHCRLGETLDKCSKFEKIDALRGRNMTITEKCYARLFTRKFLNEVLQWYHGNPQLRFRRDDYAPTEFAGMISAYLRFREKMREITLSEGE